MYAYTSWQSGMDISVHHLRQRDLPDSVFPGGRRPAADLPLPAAVPQPALAAKASSAAVAGVNTAAQEANANLAQAMQAADQEAAAPHRARPMSGEKRRRVEEKVGRSPGGTASFARGKHLLIFGRSDTCLPGPALQGGPKPSPSKKPSLEVDCAAVHHKQHSPGLLHADMVSGAALRKLSSWAQPCRRAVLLPLSWEAPLQMTGVSPNSSGTGDDQRAAMAEAEMSEAGDVNEWLGVDSGRRPQVTPAAQPLQALGPWTAVGLCQHVESQMGPA